MKAFLTFIVLWVVVSVGVSVDLQERAKVFQAECLVESGVEVEALSAYYKYATHPLKMFALCMLVKADIMTKEGRFNKSAAFDNIPAEGVDREYLRKVIDFCARRKGSSAEDAAWNYFLCYYENSNRKRKHDTE